MNSKHSVILAGLLLFSAASAEAQWYGDGTKTNADIIMKEVRYPFWAKGWYNAFWNGKFLPKGGSYYGGFASYGPGEDAPVDAQKAYFPELVWTFWGSADYRGLEVRNLYVSPLGIDFKGHGLEGAQGGASGHPPFMRPNAWYNMLMRTWPDEDADEVSYVGWWIKDMAAKEWHTIGIFRIPCRVTGFSGNAEFAEVIGAREVNRVFERRNAYCRAGEQWHHLNTITCSSAGNATLTTQGAVIRFESFARSTPNEGGISARVPEQPGPVLDQPAIQSAEALACQDQVLVRWQIPRAASPQRAYRLTAYAEPDAAGKAVATLSKPFPHIRQDCLSAPRARSVKLTVTDVFDQETSRIIPVAAVVPQKAVADVAGRRSGMQYRYYEAPRDVKWTELPDLGALKPVKSGIIQTMDDTIRERRGSQYAICFDGYLAVPEDGIYLFEYRMAGAGRLAIGGEPVIDSGGAISRSPIRQAVALAQGLHPVRLDSLKVASVRTLQNSIEIRWAGRDGVFKEIDSDVLSCGAGEALPALALNVRAVSQHVARITPAIARNGRESRKIEYYSGANLIRAVYPVNPDDPLSIDLLVPGNGGPPSTSDLISGFLLPQGANTIQARLWTQDDRTVFSNGLRFEVGKSRPTPPWRMTADHSNDAPFGVSTTADAIALVGEGDHFVHQAIAGDFTLTAHLARSPRTGKENNSGYAAGNRFGLQIGGVGCRPFALYQLAHGGVKVSVDNAGLEGWGVSYWKMPLPEYPWFRIAREGNLARAFVSVDGTNWVSVAERIGGIPPAVVQAGLTYRAGPDDAALYHAAMDRIDVEPMCFDLPRIVPSAAELATERRITAVLQSPTHPDILLARTTHAGVLKSTDRGRTWRPLNATIPDTQLATRSIAIHPGTPDILLRASGGTAADGAPIHLLYRSADGGRTWKEVAANIDFGITGPALLFGEIIAFDPGNPDVVAAGGESAGLFISRDAGKTWSAAGLANEWISTLAFHPYMAQGKPNLLVGTMSDAEWAAFGVPAPRRADGRESRGHAEGKILLADAGGAKWAPLYRHAKLGVLRFAPVKSYSKFVCATTRGVYYTSFYRHDLFLRPFMPRQTPYLALAEALLDPVQRTIENRGRESEHYCAPFAAKASADVYRSVVKAYDWTPARSSAFRRETVNEALWGRQEPGPVTNINVGMTALLRDTARDHTVYACNANGLFISTDFAKTWRSLLATP